ncbi:MAG: hypothetical protein ACO3AF_03900 [Flavobacteriales bacterium]
MSHMRICITALLLLVSWTSVQAQRIAMIDLKGHPDTLVSRLVLERGFKALPNQGAQRVIEGVLNGDSVQIHIYATSVTQRVWKAVVYHRPTQNFKAALRDLDAKVAKLEGRYGKAVTRTLDKKNKRAQVDWGAMPFFQNLHLVAEVHNGRQVAVHFILRDEEMKYEEERLINGTPLF